MRSQRPVNPPAFATRILLWYCKNANIEDLQGDLEELFACDLQSMSPSQAKRRYWRNVVSLIFSYTIKKRKQTAAYHFFSFTILHPAMLKNYFLIAARNLARHKFFTIINIMGLAIGMSISLLFIAMLSFLWRYDDFHTRKDNIYRVISTIEDGDKNEKYASAPSPLAEKLRNDYTGLEKVVRINSGLSGEARFGEKKIPLSGYFVDAEFLEVFTFPLLTGTVQSALDKPNTLLITETASKKMFGIADPIGKVISLAPFGDFEITGLLKDPPKNSHMQFEILGSYQTLLSLRRAGKIGEIDSWNEFRNSYIYLLLSEKAQQTRIKTFLSDISRRVYTGGKDPVVSFRLQPLKDISPGEDLNNQIGPSWDYSSLGIFAFLTMMILVPACFNYANISISRALKRMKEIGLRKVMGGQRSQIFIQFITETVVISLAALVLSYMMFHVIRGQFLMLLVDSSALQLDVDLRTALMFIGFAVSVGLIAGLVPAMYFSRLTPIESLKSKPAKSGFTNLAFRKVLVVSQFALSLGFIMSVVIVLNQYRYTINFDTGFRQNNILDVQLQDADPEIFRNEFSRLSSVQAISMSSHVLGTAVAETVQVQTPGEYDSTEVFQMFVDDRFIPNMGLTMLAGSNFSSDSKSNERFVIVNEEFLKAFHIPGPSAAAGKSFTLSDQSEVTILGVVKDFHYMHLREPIKSFFFRCDPSRFQVANVKMLSADVFAAITAMESTWKSITPDQPFSARFLEDEIQETYAFYFSMIKICGFLGFLAISIASLGLLGMVVFTVENRVKEVGIRKVMGASEANVIILLSKHFAKLMLVAAAIAVPVTWAFFEKIYLPLYYYKIEIGFFEIGVSILVMLIIGLTTILSQTMKAAKANPVDILRAE